MNTTLTLSDGHRVGITRIGRYGIEEPFPLIPVFLLAVFVMILLGLAL